MNHLSHQWVDLARDYFDMDKAEVEQIEAKYPRALKRQVRGFLDIWHDKHASRATEAVMTSALREIGQVSLAEEIERLREVGEEKQSGKEHEHTTQTVRRRRNLSRSSTRRRRNLSSSSTTKDDQRVQMQGWIGILLYSGTSIGPVLNTYITCVVWNSSYRECVRGIPGIPVSRS